MNLRRLAAAALLAPLLVGCGSGYFTEVSGTGGGGGGGGGGAGGGGGGSTTLIQLVLSPKTIVVGYRATVQFAASGTLSDGSSTVPSVTYKVTGGLMSPGGLFTAGAVAATDTVTVTQLGGLSGTPPCCADTAVVTVTANPPTLLAMVSQPGGAVDGKTFTQQPVVMIEDALQRQLLESGVAVSVAIASGTGTLSGTTTVTTDTNGRAVFTGLAITGTGTFTLTFTSPGLTSVTSASFDVTP